MPPLLKPKEIKLKSRLYYDQPCINSSTVVRKEVENILTLSQCGVLSLWSLDYDDESDNLASPIKLVS